MGGGASSALAGGISGRTLALRAQILYDHTTPRRTIGGVMRRAVGCWLSVIGLAGVGRAGPAGSEPAKGGARGGRLFQPPPRPGVPAGKGGAWAANPIDYFILARLEEAGLQPTRRADKLRLL